MSESDAPDCPLCMETFEIDDLHFYPCTCGYQICRFCWHRIRTDENGLCPACRKTYSEDPAEYQPLSQDELHKIKKERKQREVQHKQKLSDNRQHLSNIRVIQKHLVFVVGLSNKMADPEVLKKQEYFGRYGKILKIVINPNTNYAGPQGPSASAYITYAKEDEALRAILSINTMQPPLKIRASLGTTKYCTHYLRNTQCPKQDCMYLHDVGDMNASFTKDDMQAGKHQLFEKNLLDNFMASVQKQKQLHAQNSNSCVDNIEDTSEEAWREDDELVDNSNLSNAVLPSKASWAVIKDEHEADSNSETQVSTEYPNLDSGSSRRKSSEIKSISESSIGKLDVIDVNDDDSAGVDDNVILENIVKPTDVITEKTNVPPGYTAGWSTSTQEPFDEKQKCPQLTTNITHNLPSNNTPSPISKHTNTNTQAATAYPWPCISDLGLSDLRINPSDDELGFDPFNESKSGLEDLIASEKKQGMSSSTQSNAPKPSFHWDSFLPSYYGTGGMPTGGMSMMMSSLNSYSLFGAVPSMTNPQMPNQIRPTCPSMNSYDGQPSVLPMGASSTIPPPPPNANGQNPAASLQYRFSNPINPSLTNNPLLQQPSQSGKPQQPTSENQEYLHRFPFNLSSGLQQQSQPGSPQQTQPPLLQQQPTVSLSTSITTTTSTTSTTSSTTPTNSKNWQDGLRALLPNINISFAANWNGIDGSPPPLPTQEQQQPTQPQSPHQIPINMASPPPGFSAITNFPNEAKPSWASSAPAAEKSSQRLPAPPPGFRKPAETAFVPIVTSASLVSSSSVATGLLSMATTSNIDVGSITSSLSSSTSSNSSLSNRNSLILSSSTNSNIVTEDPSILWSRVLSDKATKEIETTNMAFPLPGETLDQALSSVNSLPVVNPQPNAQQQQMMSWNSVVSGNQFGSKASAADIISAKQQPLDISAKESKDSGKPQKPSPIFGNQQKHAVKKPTAHVKPLKCTAPSDGFTTVLNSRQTIGNVHTGSRVSELDDFSTDLPVPIIPNINVTANVVSNFIDYPPVAAAPSLKTGGKKKKNKKGKEQSGAISEVIVGVSLSERPPIQLVFEEERPKKGGKNKKKGGVQKPSPPSQRKIIIDDASQPEQQQQQIRILKSDSNSSSAPSSPTQSVAGHFPSSNSSQQHDQEIVSRLTESTEKLLKNVLYETEAIKLNTEQISKDLKSALEKCKESSLSLSDLEKINLLLTPGKFPVNDLDESDLVDTTDLEMQVESARREAKMLEARLNDVIRKNMASELETLKRNTKSS